MSFLKKQSAGFFVTLLAIILAFVSVIFYLINCNTAYFATYGTDHSIVAMIIIAIVIEIAYITGSELVYSNLILDILPKQCSDYGRLVQCYHWYGFLLPGNCCLCYIIILSDGKGIMYTF